MKIKAITLWQPWASLVAIGAKQIETRYWPTSYRGPLAIHAAKRFPEEAQKLFIELPFWNALRDAGYKYASKLPRGAIIATCRLVDCRKVIENKEDENVVKLENGFYVFKDGREYAFGDYTPGRFAWILDDIRPLPKPVPAKGRQGLWEWEVPEGVILP